MKIISLSTAFKAALVGIAFGSCAPAFANLLDYHLTFEYVINNQGKDGNYENPADATVPGYNGNPAIHAAFANGGVSLIGDELVFDGIGGCVAPSCYIHITSDLVTLTGITSLDGQISPDDLTLNTVPAYALHLNNPKGIWIDLSGGEFLQNAAFRISAVPEPSTTAMLIAGFGLIGFAATRRRRASAPSVTATFC
jgi:hypothetical protein